MRYTAWFIFNCHIYSVLQCKQTETIQQFGDQHAGSDTVPATLFFTNDRIGLTHDTIEYTHDRTRFTHDTIGLIYDRIG